MGLAGQAGGLATAELLAGIVNPSGKLAETYPIRYADVPSAELYETGGKQAQYREGIYVGYRYYDKAAQDVLFPFGHGLSYTTFEYSDLVLSHTELETPPELSVSVSVTNTGGVDGAEIVQVYVGAVDSPVFRPEKELKEFAKVVLTAGETRRVQFRLDARAFAIYDVEVNDWVVPGGDYRISVGASSRDIRLQGEVTIRGEAVPSASREISGWYSNPAGQVTQADFETLLGREIEPVKPWRKGDYTLACSFEDMKDSFLVRQIIKVLENTVIKAFGGADDSNPTLRMVMVTMRHMPLRGLSLISPDRLPKHVTQGIVHLANGRLLPAIRAFARKPKGPR
jgi:beta-glucosidase